MAADPAHPRRDAGHAAAVHRDRVPLHLLGTGPPGRDAAGLPAAGRGRDLAVRGARPDARHERGAGHRADDPPGRRDRDHRGADVHDLGRPRRRVLRRDRRAGRRVAGHRPRLHQGPGRAADPRAGPHADPRGAGAAGGQAAGAARALHDRAVPAGLPGRAGPGRGGAAGRLRRAGRRVLAARRRTHGGEPARAGAHGDRGRPAAGPGGAVLRPARGRGVAAVRAAAAVRRGVHPAPGGRRRADHAAAAAGRDRARVAVRRGAGRGEPGPGRARLPDHGHAVPADGDAGRRCPTWSAGAGTR